MKDAAEISETYLTQSKKPVTSVPSSPIHQKCMILNFHIEKHFFFLKLQIKYEMLTVVPSTSPCTWQVSLWLSLSFLFF